MNTDRIWKNRWTRSEINQKALIDTHPRLTSEKKIAARPASDSRQLQVPTPQIQKSNTRRLALGHTSPPSIEHTQPTIRKKPRKSPVPEKDSGLPAGANLRKIPYYISFRQIATGSCPLKAKTES
ncbi:uncharacterized protein L3040_004310 [Drepanopeziza brunnea f. sp. 'multigermtubi']|uniref:uncharacterized protein n=1 Tax=Drepanopeziza brunnea f. sp. 'multigermtubi' TaxID=698441 RepID=UPI0023A71A97|nr:hypothetical protein L3040_004310 [Drepanopeziza brunnea f. sp. 'multigermtubi']